MARERWFYEHESERKGPFSLERLVVALRTLPQPRSCLVWKVGMSAWTSAGEIPEIERQLPAPPAAPPAQPAFYPAAAPPGDGGLGGAAARDLGTGRLSVGAEAGYGGAAVARPAEGERGRNPMVYVGGTAAVLAVAGVAAWLLFFKSPPPGPTATGPSPSSATQPGVRSARPPGPNTIPKGSSEPTPPTPEPTARGEPSKPQAFGGWSDTELPLASSELAKLRGVAGWSGDKLTITLYNGSTWRVTELLVKTSRLEGDKFVDAPSPALLLPVSEQIDSSVAQILKRVAPDRRKPGTNPLDTGAFEAKVGPQPEAYRWKIEGAKGYPPRGES